MSTLIFLINYLKMIGFYERESKTLARKLQIKSISGTAKICKTLLTSSDPFNPRNSKGLRLRVVLGIALAPEFA